MYESYESWVTEKCLMSHIYITIAIMKCKAFLKQNQGLN